MDPEDDNFNCHVCMTAYNDPRILPCGHSFCLRCLSQIAGNSNNFLCPTCRKIVNLKALKDRKVNALPINYSLRCFMEAKEQASVCSEHNKLLDIFCGQCDMVICSKCLSSLHAGHVTKDIDNVCTERKKNLEQFLETTKLWFSKVKQKEESIKVSRLSMQKDADYTRGTVAVIFKKWYDALRAQETASLSYVTKETEKRMKVFDEAERVLQKFLTCLDDTERKIKEILRNEKIRILQAYDSVKARHEDNGNRVLQDVENCCKPPKDLKIPIQAPWMDEAILNIKPFDTVTAEASSRTQKVADIIEENSSLKRLKTNFEKYKNETIAHQRGHQEEIEKLTEEIKTLKERLKTNSDKYENETKAIKRGHQEEIEKLTEENKTLKERLKTNSDKYENETKAIKRGHQEETEKLTEENKTLKERLKTNSDKYENETKAIKRGHQEEIDKIAAEIKTLKERLKTNSDKYENETKAIKRCHQEETEKLTEEIKVLKERLKTNYEKYENEAKAIQRANQEETEKLTEEIKALKERLKTNSDKYENETKALKRGHQEKIEKLMEEKKTLKERNSKDEGGYKKRQNLSSPSDDLDTTQLCINLTNLKRSCKRLDYLKTEIAKETKKKAEKERKKKSYLEDSDSIKEKKEMYRVLYDEILVLRLEVDCLFDASRPPSVDKRDDQEGFILTEIRRPNRRSTRLDKDGFEKSQVDI